MYNFTFQIWNHGSKESSRHICRKLFVSSQCYKTLSVFFSYIHLFSHHMGYIQEDNRRYLERDWSKYSVIQGQDFLTVENNNMISKDYEYESIIFLNRPGRCQIVDCTSKVIFVNRFWWRLTFSYICRKISNVFAKTSRTLSHPTVAITT